MSELPTRWKLLDTGANYSIYPALETTQMRNGGTEVLWTETTVIGTAIVNVRNGHIDCTLPIGVEVTMHGGRIVMDTKGFAYPAMEGDSDGTRYMFGDLTWEPAE